MDSSSSHQSDNPKPERLKILASKVKFRGRNTLLHQFVIDNSHPNDSGSENFINAVLMSMSGVPADVVNALNFDGYTALHLAVLKNNLLMVTKLLSCLLYVDVNARCRWNSEHTALHLAVELGYLSIIQELIDKRADVDLKNNCRESALCVAARLGRLDAVKLLVTKGANVNLRCGLGTPLCYAVRPSNLEGITILVSRVVNFRDGWTPLCYAAESGSLAIVEFLVSNGADVNIKFRISDETPLHYAARKASSEIVAYLVSNGADINAKDYVGQTPLHHAITVGKSENVASLLDHGADINARDGSDETPLHCAVKQRNSVIYNFLNEWEYFNLGSLRAFPDEVIRRNIEIVEILLELGADLRAIEEDGSTPLHDAVFEECFQFKKFLLDQGKRLHAAYEWSPKVDAAYRDKAKVIRMLLDKRAVMNAKNKDGETPLDLARNESCIHALKRLRSYVF